MERGCGEEAVERVTVRPGHGAGCTADRRIEAGDGAALLFEHGGKAGQEWLHFGPFANANLLGDLEKGDGADQDCFGGVDGGEGVLRQAAVAG